MLITATMPTIVSTELHVPHQRRAEQIHGGEIEAAEERHREARDLDPVENGDRGSGRLPEQLRRRRQVPEVIGDADERDHDRAGEQSVRQRDPGKE
jgi:hypothetical protein